MKTANDRSESKEHDSFLIANFADTVNRLRYTYETHEKAAPRYTNYEIARKRILIVCTTLATGTFVTSLFAVADSKSPGPVSVGLFAALATFAAFIGDVLDFSRKQQRHNEVPLT